jgi:hypothetical protein
MVGFECGQAVDALGVAQDACGPVGGGAAAVLVVEQAAVAGRFHERHRVSA